MSCVPACTTWDNLMRNGHLAVTQVSGLGTFGSLTILHLMTMLVYGGCVDDVWRGVRIESDADEVYLISRTNPNPNTNTIQSKYPPEGSLLSTSVVDVKRFGPVSTRRSNRERGFDSRRGKKTNKVRRIFWISN